MSVSFVAKGAFASAASTSVSVAMPTGIQQDDFLLLIIADYTSSPSLPSGWTNIGTGNTTGIYTRTCYKIAGSSNSAVTVSGGLYISGQVYAFRGVNTSSPIDVNTSNTDSGTTFSANGVTTTVANAMVIIAVGFTEGSSSDDTSNFSSWANANLASITEADDQYSGTSWMGITVAYGIKTSAGATGATTATTDSSSDYACSFTIALAPAPVSVSITGVVATCAAAAPAPAVTTSTGATDVSITGVVAAAPCAAVSPVITAIRNASITGVITNSPALAIAPTITAIRNASVTDVCAVAPATALSPLITAIRNASVAATLSTAPSAAKAPAVTGQINISTTAVVAASPALACIPTVTGIKNASVSSITALASAVSLPPTITAVRVVSVSSVPANAVAAAPAPSPVVSSVVNSIVLGVQAGCVSSAQSPSVSTTYCVEIVVPVSSATAAFIRPRISLIIPTAFWGICKLAEHKSLAQFEEHGSTARIISHQSRAYIEVYDMIYTNDHFRAHALFKTFPAAATSGNTGNTALAPVPYTPDAITLTVRDKAGTILNTYTKDDMVAIATGHYIIDVITPATATRLYLEWYAEAGVGAAMIPSQCESTPEFVDVFARRGATA